MAQALILSADEWSMTDEKTGQINEGTSVWYLNDYRESTEKSIGYKPTKISATPEVVQAIREKKVVLPALFEMGYDSRPGAQGKASLVLIGAKHIRNVTIFGA